MTAKSIPTFDSKLGFRSFLDEPCSEGIPPWHTYRSWRAQFLPALVFLVVVFTFHSHSSAQALEDSPISKLRPMTQTNRVGTEADAGEQQLKGHIPGWVGPERQVSKAVDPDTPMHLSIILSRDPAVQAAFTQFLDDQQNPKSPYYHQWLKPEQIGELFGPTQPDIDALTHWLTAQGLKVESIAPSRIIVEVSGNVALVGAALRTNFGYFTLNQKPVLSAVSDPFVPSALAPLIKSIHGLTQVPLEAHPPVTATSAKSSGPTTEYTETYPSGPERGQIYGYNLVPADFNTIYDVAPILNAGNMGATIGAGQQRVAIVGRSRVSAGDTAEFENLFGLPPVAIVTIIPPNGVDPGGAGSFSGDETEADLDIQRVIGTAPGVGVDLVVSGMANGQDGIYPATSYAVDTVLDPIINISFGFCEAVEGASGVNFFDSLFSSAAAEGISVFVSAGDAGADGCDSHGNPPPSTPQSLSPNYICASSYATCVGGTEFNDFAVPSPYWAATNGPTLGSAYGYIPEGAWNESTSGNISGGGGGVSGYITKPSWQTGLNVPNDGYRDTPDIAFNASTEHGYVVCQGVDLQPPGMPASNACFSAAEGGTSAAAPAMAGITALLNTATGSIQGNMNPLIYRLAATTPSAFHDVTVASSGVTDCTAQVVSICNNSDTTLGGGLGLAGYVVGPGYDQVTGWGSLDAGVFVAVATAPPAATTLAVASGQTIVGGSQPVTLTAAISSADTISYPTGTVQFYANGTALDPPVPVGTNANYASAYNISGSNPYGTPITTPAANGIAILTTNLTLANTYAITAVYSGDPSFQGSTSPAVSVTVPNDSYVIYSPVLTQGSGQSVGAILASSNQTFYYPLSAYLTGSGARFFSIDFSSITGGQGGVGAMFGAAVNFNPTYVPAGGQLIQAQLVIEYLVCLAYPNTVTPNFNSCTTETTNTLVAGVATGSPAAVPAQLQFTPTKPVALFAAPGARSVTADQSGNIYVSYGASVEEYSGSNWTAIPFAGTGVAGYSGDGGAAVSAQLDSVDAMLVMGQSLILADSPNNLARSVTNGTIQTYAGSYYPPSALRSAVGGGSGYCGTTTSNYVFYTAGCYSGLTMGTAPYEVTSGPPYYLLGTGYGGTGGFSTGPNNYLNYPAALATDGLNVYVADTDNSALRQINPQGEMYTLAGVTNCSAEGFLSSGLLSTFCNIYPGDSGDGGFAWNADIEVPNSVAVDPYGNVFIASTVSPVLYGNPYISSFLLSSNVPLSTSIREVGVNNIITTPTFNGAPLAGTGLVFDNLGNLYITGNNTTPLRCLQQPHPEGHLLQRQPLERHQLGALRWGQPLV